VAISLLIIDIFTAYSSDCKCDFDTSRYSAECDCALTCSIAMEGNRHCYIVCDGVPRNAAGGLEQLYGSPYSYVSDMRKIKSQMFTRGFAVFQNRSFARWALPRLLRAAYIGAPFVDAPAKRELDRQVRKVFLKFGEEIWGYFIGKYSGVLEADLNGEIQIRVTLKTIKLILPSHYSLKLSFLN